MLFNTFQKVSAGCLVAALVASSLPAQAAFSIQKKAPSASTTEAAEAPAFDVSQYEVWVDNTYTSVREYGVRGNYPETHTYGDPMPLVEALRLLVPSNWKVMRAKDVAAASSQEKVSWDLRGSWIDVLSNLGSQYGYRFHVDHNNRQLYIQKGLSDLRYVSTYAAASFRAPADMPRSAIVAAQLNPQGKPSSAPAAVNEPKSATLPAVFFEVLQHAEGESSARDLMQLLGYREVYWMLPSRKTDIGAMLEGSADMVVDRFSALFGAKACLYEKSYTAVFIPQTTGCPQ